MLRESRRWRENPIATIQAPVAAAASFLFRSVRIDTSQTVPSVEINNVLCLATPIACFGYGKVVRRHLYCWPKMQRIWPSVPPRTSGRSETIKAGKRPCPSGRVIKGIDFGRHDRPIVQIGMCLNGPNNCRNRTESHSPLLKQRSILKLNCAGLKYGHLLEIVSKSSQFRDWCEDIGAHEVDSGHFAYSGFG